MPQRSKTSSARAAQSVLNADGKIATVGFGGSFVGSEAVEEATSDALLALTGEYQALLKQLSKRNAATKIKALQGLEGLLKEDTVENVKIVMRQWLLSYRLLTRDLESAVRLKTAEVVDVMVMKLKRELAPFLKELMGPWWVAQHDIHEATAQMAHSTFQGVFVGEKAQKALLYCVSDLGSYLAESLQATPDTIGDPNKESKEDREHKWESCMRAALCASTSFFEQLNPSRGQDAVSEALERVGSVLLKKELLKGLLNSPLVSIRRDAYKAVQQFCQIDSKLLSEQAVSIAVLLFNTLSEKDPDCHNPMWDLLLTVIKKCPEVWNHVSVEKGVLPKLCSFLRHGGYGSAEHSYSAVLPFVSQIPSEHWNGSPSLLIRVFQSACDGVHGANDALNRATLVLLHECVLWGLLTAASSIPDESEEAFREELIHNTTHERVLPQMLDRSGERHRLALQLLSKTLCSLASASARTPENKTHLRVLKQLKKGISEKMIHQWGHQEEAGEVLEAICELYEEMVSVENLAEAAKQRLIEVFVQPLCIQWTEEAFSNKPQSHLFAKYLLRASRIFDTAVVHFKQHEAEHLPLNTLREIRRLIGGDQGMDEAEGLFDLLVFVLSRHPLHTRADQWGAVLLELFPRDEPSASAGCGLFVRLLRRFKVSLEREEIPGLVTQELRPIAEDCVKNWHKNETSGFVTALLIEMQSTFLSPECYVEMLEAFTKTMAIPVEDGWSEESIKDVMSAVFSKSAIEKRSVDSEVVKSWSRAVMMFVMVRWGVYEISDQVMYLATAAWEESSFLDELDPAFSKLLAADLRAALMAMLLRVCFEPCLEADYIGGMLALRVMDIFRVTTAEVGPVLDEFFQATDWCEPLLENKHTAYSNSPKKGTLPENMCACAERVILEKGAEIFREASIRESLFLTVLCCGHGDQRVDQAIAQEVMWDLLEKEDSSLAWSILERSIPESIREYQINFANAANTVLRPLIEKSENLSCLRLLERSCALLIEDVEYDIERLWDLGLYCSDEEEPMFDDRIGCDARSVDYIFRLAPIFRQSSLASVVNAGLDQITVPCMEACVKHFETGQRCRKDQLREIWHLVKCSFPVPQGTPLETASFYSTPAEKQGLVKFTKASVGYRHAKEMELWRVCRVYAAQDFSNGDWESLLTLNCTKIKERALKCEEIVEEYIQSTIERVQEIAPSANLSTPTMALQLLQRLPYQTARMDFSFSVNWRFDEADMPFKDETDWMKDMLRWMGLLWLSVQSRDTGAGWSDGSAQKLREGIHLSVRVVFCYSICCVIESKTNGSCHGSISMATSALQNLDPLRKLFETAFEDRTLLKEVVEGIDLWAETTGVDAVAALLELCFSSDESRMFPECEYYLDFQSYGLKLLGSEICMGKLIHEGSTSVDLEAQLQGQEAVAQNQILLAAGVHPELIYKLEKLSGNDLLLVWALVLMYLETGSHSHRHHVSQLLRNLPSLIQQILNCLLELLPEPPAKSQKKTSPALTELKGQLEREVMRREDFTLQELIQSIGAPKSEKEWTVLAMKMYHVMLVTCPVSVRLWFHDLKSKHKSEAIQQYTTLCETPQLIQQEFNKIITTGPSEGPNLNVRGIMSRREIIATIEVEDNTTIDLTIKLPDCMPLKAMTVECDMKVRVQDAMLRKWLFSVSAFLANHSGSVMEAVEIWNRSLHELRSLETCLICFSILHPTTRETPSLSCKTCHLRFHSACLYTWFRQSAKSLCPHCQAPWSA